MAAADLPENLRLAGAKLLAALDDAGLQAQGAAWIFDHALGDWRFVVVTSLVETMGRTKVYRELLTVMKKLAMPEEMTINDVHLESTEGALFKGLSRFVHVKGGGVAVFRNCLVNGAKFDAHIYRWAPAPSSKAEAQNVERQFKRRIKELAHS
jgi:hypothetical protein